MHARLAEIGAALLLSVGASICASPGVAATTFSGGVTSVDANTSDPGLVFIISDVNNSFGFDLDVGEWSDPVSLFKMSTDEGATNPDDQVAKPIEVSVSFDQPPPTFGNSGTGETYGTNETTTISIGWFSYDVDYSEAHLDWDGPVDIAFGPNGDGVLQMVLEDADFLLTGTHYLSNETVKASFHLISEATPAVSEVPLPAALPLFGSALGFLGLGGWWKRRRGRDQDLRSAHA